MKPNVTERIKAARQLVRHIDGNGYGKLGDFESFCEEPAGMTAAPRESAFWARQEACGVATKALQRHVKLIERSEDERKKRARPA